MRKPVYLLAGGQMSQSRQPDPLLCAVFEQAGVERPSVAYIGAASEDDRGFYKWAQTAFLKSGAGAVEHAVLCGGKKEIKEAAGAVNACDIVFLSGGDVEMGMRALHRSGFLEILRLAFDSGKLFFGLSAGSIMLSKAWIKWDDPMDDKTASLFPCLGFAPVFCDTHAEKDGWEELKALLSLLKKGEKAYGIPSGGGLKVFQNGTIESLVKPAVRL